MCIFAPPFRKSTGTYYLLIPIAASFLYFILFYFYFLFFPKAITHFSLSLSSQANRSVGLT